MASDSNNMIYRYLRDKNNRKIGVALALCKDGVYSIGVSVVNRAGGDVFNSHRGIEMAHGRALKVIENWQKSVNHARAGGHPYEDIQIAISVPARVFDDVSDFATRATHYFKDKKSAIGKIEPSTITMNFEKSVQELTNLFDGNYKARSLKKEAEQLKKIGQALEVVGTTQDKNNMTKVLKT